MQGVFAFYSGYTPCYQDLTQPAPICSIAKCHKNTAKKLTVAEGYILAQVPSIAKQARCPRSKPKSAMTNISVSFMSERRRKIAKYCKFLKCFITSLYFAFYGSFIILSLVHIHTIASTTFYMPIPFSFSDYTWISYIFKTKTFRIIHWMREFFSLFLDYHYTFT